MRKYYTSFDPRETLPQRSPILPHLYMGCRPDTYVGYALVVSCEKHLSRKPMEGYEGLTLHLPMRDEDDYAIPERAIEHAASLITEVLSADGDVLIHCSGGLNRSGLVAARAVQRYMGCTAEQAIKLLRRSRDEGVLSNRQFERWVLRIPLPTAETSAFREQ